MTNSTIVKNIRQNLENKADPKFQKGAFRFFKEEVKILGVRSPEVKRMATKFWLEIENQPKTAIFDLCEELWKTGFLEETMIAINWTERLMRKFDKANFERFESWIKKYVTNWAACDVFCTHSVGYLVDQYPELIRRLKTWTKSKNRWFRRAAAVTMIYPFHKMRKQKFRDRRWLKETFAIADLLFANQDDLVQKGYGWLLKVASNLYPKEVFDFVMARKDKMPRTALRYAIEKLPLEQRKLAMKK